MIAPPSSEVQSRYRTRRASAALVLLCVYIAEFQVLGDDSVMIVKSGSTNTNAFRIVVERSGEAELTPEPRGIGPKEPVHRKVSEALVHNLYSDLDSAKPISSLPRPRCFKSASFGVRLTVKLGADETPDLSCGDGGNARLAALIRDVNQIVNVFNVK